MCGSSSRLATAIICIFESVEQVFVLELLPFYSDLELLEFEKYSKFMLSCCNIIVCNCSSSMLRLHGLRYGPVTMGSAF